MRSLLFSVVALAGCGSSAQKTIDEFPVTVIARFEDGRPAPGASCSAPGTKGVRTGPDGKATFRIYGSDGEQVRVAIVPPEGYRVIKADLEVPLRRGIPLGGGDEQPIPVQREVTFAPTQRTYAIMVRTDGRLGLPIETYGKPVAATNEQGVALFMYRGVPGTELEVRVLTANAPNLKPANPRKTFLLPDHDDAFVFRQAFKEEDVRGARRRPAVAPERGGSPVPIRRPRKGSPGGDDGAAPAPERPQKPEKREAPTDEPKGPMRL